LAAVWAFQPLLSAFKPYYSGTNKMSVFNYQKDDQHIVTVTMDMTGPVNAMNDEFDQAIAAAIEKLEAEPSLTGVIFASAKQTFFAGGDLNMLLSVQPGEEGAFFNKIEAAKAKLRRLEKLPVPVVAAINGAALGGGYEICLSCNYRIAWNNRVAQVGLPEVGLGLLPGGGGVVRMVNKLGLQAALPYLLEGKKMHGEKALQAGLIDELVEQPDQLISTAKSWILAHQEDETASIQPWDRKGHRIPGGNANSPKLTQVLMAAPAMLRKKTKGLMPAPEFILDVAVEAARLDFDTALRVEGRHFAKLVTTPQAKNMISSLFFGLNKVNGGNSRPKDQPKQQVKKVGILGAGMMGQGIAYVSAMAGIEVVLKDVSLTGAEKGKAYSAALLDKRIAKGRMDQAKRDAVLALITPTDKAEDLEGCDLIVEAVFESIDLKHTVTKQTESQLTEDGVWGSNTSSLPITLLAEASHKPENFIGIHFFSPVDKMPLVEIICGEKTSERTLALAFDYTRQIKKTPIVVKDSLGFYTSRTILAQISEALSMVVEGVHPARIDNAALAIGLPVGSLTISDEIGFETPHLMKETHRKLGLFDDAMDPTPLSTQLNKEMVETGRVGKKVGKGFYDWSESGKTLSQEIIDKYTRQEVHMPQHDIEDRLLFRPVIESLLCLQEGVLLTVEDANIGSIMGIGAPVWTGGYLQFLNTYGLQKFINRCDELAECYGERFRAPQIAKDKLASGELFD
jgi:3-hydroxyacyl-CoA dehydrogenase/enoyl-CoA hydratase/3-hydroxybutyryl-CoA epimerase